MSYRYEFVCWYRPDTRFKVGVNDKDERLPEYDFACNSTDKIASLLDIMLPKHSKYGRHFRTYQVFAVRDNVSYYLGEYHRMDNIDLDNKPSNQIVWYRPDNSFTFVG